MRRRNPNTGLVVFWVKLRQRGYCRSISGLYRVLRRTGQGVVKLPNPKYIPKPYEQMQYPGQRCQIDVKFVPAACLVGAAAEQKYYQYTFIDEYSRFRYLEAFEEHSTYSSTQFLLHVIKKFPFQIECIQTDNGLEFTNRLNSKGTKRQTLFEKTLAQMGISHKLIRPFTPRHNGKVERSHRKDNEEFYASHKFYSFADFEKQLAVRQRQYNNFPMRPLNWQSPKTVLYSFPNVSHIIDKPTNRPGIKGIGIWCAVIIAILVLFFSDISNVEFAFTGHIAFWTPGMDCPKGNQQKMLISKLRFAKIYHDSGRANRLPCHLRELRYT